MVSVSSDVLMQQAAYEIGRHAVPKEPKQIAPSTTASTQGVNAPVARVPDNPELNTRDEFNQWAGAYALQARRDLIKRLSDEPVSTLGF